MCRCWLAWCYSYELTIADCDLLGKDFVTFLFVYYLGECIVQNRFPYRLGSHDTEASLQGVRIASYAFPKQFANASQYPKLTKKA